MSDTIDRKTFETIYKELPAWDIDGPQEAFRALGKLEGSLLDSGCGTGENALWFASQGARVTGIDFLPGPIASAEAKATARKLPAAFLTRDALTLGDWAARFDNAIDSGLFHVFGDADRARYVAGLHTVIKPGGRLYILCFSDKTPGTEGPRRITRADLEAAFAHGWQLEAAEPTRFAVRPEALGGRFSGEAPHAWSVRVLRSPL